MSEKSEAVEIDLQQLLRQLLRYTWVVVLVAVLMAGMFFAYAKCFVTPMYAASVRLYTNNIYEESTGEIQAGQLTAAYYLSEAYMVILEAKPVLNEVLKITNLQGKYTVDQLRAMVTADTINETEIFEVTITCPNSKEAAVLANAFAEVLPEQLPRVVEGSDVRIVDYAVESKTIVSPSYIRYVVVGAALGAVLSAVTVLMKEFLDDGIYSEEYLTANYSDLPLLAVVPDVNQEKNYKYYRGYYTSEYRNRSAS